MNDIDLSRTVFSVDNCIRELWFLFQVARFDVNEGLFLGFTIGNL